MQGEEPSCRRIRRCYLRVPRERGRGVTSRVKATQSWASRTLLTAGIGEMCSAQGRTRAADVAVGEQADNAASPSMLPAGALYSVYSPGVHTSYSYTTRCPPRCHDEHELELAGRTGSFLFGLPDSLSRGCLPVPLPRADPSQLCLCLPERTSPQLRSDMRRGGCNPIDPRASSFAACCFRWARPLLFFPVRSAPEGPAVRRTSTEPETPVGLHPTHMTSHHACLASCSASCRVCF